MDKGWALYLGNTKHTTHFVFDTNDVILNRSCRDDMNGGTLYMQYEHQE